MKSLSIAALFSLAALVLAVCVEVLLIGLLDAIFAGPGYSMSPRGPGWAFFPIAATISGWRFGRQFNPNTVSPSAIRLRVDRRLGMLTPDQRLFLGYSALWVVGWSLVCAVFDPFGYRGWRWNEGQWAEYLLGCVGPIAAVFAIRKVRSWAESA